MKVLVLGSGGSEGIPVPYCDCRVCRSGDRRERTSYLIKTGKKNLLVEIGPDFRRQQLRHGFPIDYLFVSHEHHDHISGLAELRHITMVARIRIRRVDVLISRRLHSRMMHEPHVYREGIRHAYMSLARNRKIVPHKLDYYRFYDFDGFRIQLFRNRHENITCDGFLLESEGKSVAYLADAGSLYHKTEKLINEANPDLLIANTPFLFSRDQIRKNDRRSARRLRLTHHIGIDSICHLNAKRILLSHFSHRSGLTHKEIVKRISPYRNATAAMDGLELTV